MAYTTERIEEGFRGEYDALVRAGVVGMLSSTLGEALWDVYRRGYIRGHADRSREVQQEARLAVNQPIAVTYENDRLTIAGREVERQ
jgi:hypothetical protein